MLKYLFLIIYIINLCIGVNIIWTGNMDCYWNNTLNWVPNQIPTSNDNVNIPMNASIPPYSHTPIYANNLRNDLMLDLFGTEGQVRSLQNNGELNLYRTTFTVLQPINLIGQIKVIESSLTVPSITLTNKYACITGTGSIASSVYNEKGTIKLKSEHVLTFLNYTQGIEGALEYYLGLNVILSNYADISGKIYAYLYGLNNNDTQVIFKSQKLSLNNVKLVPLNNHTSGNLTLIQNNSKQDLVIYLKKH